MATSETHSVDGTILLIRNHHKSVNLCYEYNIQSSAATCNKWDVYLYATAFILACLNYTFYDQSQRYVILAVCVVAHIYWNFCCTVYSGKFFPS